MELCRRAARRAVWLRVRREKVLDAFASQTRTRPQRRWRSIKNALVMLRRAVRDTLDRRRCSDCRQGQPSTPSVPKHTQYVSVPSPAPLRSSLTPPQSLLVAAAVPPAEGVLSSRGAMAPASRRAAPGHGGSPPRLTTQIGLSVGSPWRNPAAISGSSNQNALLGSGLLTWASRLMNEVDALQPSLLQLGPSALAGHTATPPLGSYLRSPLRVYRGDGIRSGGRRSTNTLDLCRAQPLISVSSPVPHRPLGRAPPSGTALLGAAPPLVAPTLTAATDPKVQQRLPAWDMDGAFIPISTHASSSGGLPSGVSSEPPLAVAASRRLDFTASPHRLRGQPQQQPLAPELRYSRKEEKWSSQALSQPLLSQMPLETAGKPAAAGVAMANREFLADVVGIGARQANRRAGTGGGYGVRMRASPPPLAFPQRCFALCACCEIPFLESELHAHA